MDCRGRIGKFCRCRLGSRPIVFCVVPVGSLYCVLVLVGKAIYDIYAAISWIGFGRGSGRRMAGCWRWLGVAANIVGGRHVDVGGRFRCPVCVRGCRL